MSCEQTIEGQCRGWAVDARKQADLTARRPRDDVGADTLVEVLEQIDLGNDEHQLDRLSIRSNLVILDLIERGLDLERLPVQNGKLQKVLHSFFDCR